jgi:hypothetical protein
MGGGFCIDHWINLTGSCCYCHTDHHNGRRPYRRDLVVVIGRREGIQPELVDRAIHAIRWAPVGSDINKVLIEVLGERLAARPNGPLLSSVADGHAAIYHPPVASRPKGGTGGVPPF